MSDNELIAIISTYILIGLLFIVGCSYYYRIVFLKAQPVPIFTNEQAIEAMECLAERGE